MAIQLLERDSRSGEKRPVNSPGIGIHTDHFKPDPRHGFSPEVLSLREGFFGPKGLAYYVAVRTGRKAEKLREEVDAEAISNIRYIYGLDSDDAARGFYMRQRQAANQTISYILGVALPAHRQNYSLMEELESPSVNPSNSVKWGALADSEGETQMLYEVGRGELLAAIAGSLEVRSRTNRLGTVRDSIKEALFSLYERPLKPQPHTLLSEHDDETGKVVRIGDVEFGSAKETHLKTRTYTARSVKGVGRVLVGDREKGTPESIIKAILKSKDQGGWIRPEDDVTDVFGIKLTVMEPGKDGYQANVANLVGAFIEQMRSSEKGAHRLSHKIIGFETDDITSEDRASSSDHKFTRLQMHLKGVDVPFEVIFQSADQMRNDEVMHGVLSSSVLRESNYQDFQAQTGVDLRGKLYDGSAHALYRAQRLIPTLPILYPAEIYGDEIIERALDNLHTIEANLRNQDAIPLSRSLK